MKKQNYEHKIIPTKSAKDWVEKWVKDYVADRIDDLRVNENRMIKDLETSLVGRLTELEDEIENLLKIVGEYLPPDSISQIVNFDSKLDANVVQKLAQEASVGYNAIDFMGGLFQSLHSANGSADAENEIRLLLKSVSSFCSKKLGEDNLIVEMGQHSIQMLDHIPKDMIGILHSTLHEFLPSFYSIPDLLKSIELSEMIRDSDKSELSADSSAISVAILEAISAAYKSLKVSVPLKFGGHLGAAAGANAAIKVDLISPYIVTDFLFIALDTVLKIDQVKASDLP